MNLKNNLQKISLIFSIIFFIVLSVAFVFLYKKINDNNQKAEEGTASWQKEMRRREEIVSLNSSLEKIANDKVMLDTHFAQSSDVVPFLDMIEKLALKAGVVAEIVSVDNKIDNKGLVVNLKASGSFELLYKFLTLLENSPYELDFFGMDIHKVIIPNAPGKNIKSFKWEAVFKIQLLSFVL